MDFLDGNIHLKSRAGVLVLFTLQANLYTGTAIASRKSICNLGMHARSLSIISIGVIPMPFSCEEKKRGELANKQGVDNPMRTGFGQKNRMEIKSDRGKLKVEKKKASLE